MYVCTMYMCVCMYVCMYVCHNVCMYVMYHVCMYLGLTYVCACVCRPIYKL